MHDFLFVLEKKCLSCYVNKKRLHDEFSNVVSINKTVNHKKNYSVDRSISISVSDFLMINSSPVQRIFSIQMFILSQFQMFFVYFNGKMPTDTLYLSA